MGIREIAFDAADGITLRGFHHEAEGGADAAPVIVMAHGFAGTADLKLGKFAAAFAQAGLNVLVYDHRNFGNSDGAVRQEVEPFRQVEDWRDAITFAQSLPGVDPQRVGIWGSSFSGGQVMMLGATDRRVRCVVSQVPFISGSQTMARNVRPDMVAMAHGMFAHDRAERMKGAEPIRIAVTSDDPAVPAALPGKDTHDWTLQAMPGAPTFRNEVTVRSMEAAGAFEPGSYVGRITPTPFLMIVGLLDHVTVPDLALACYAQALEPKKLVMLECGHMDPYDLLFADSSGAAIAWFTQHLLKPQGAAAPAAA